MATRGEEATPTRPKQVNEELTLFVFVAVAVVGVVAFAFVVAETKSPLPPDA